MIATVAIQPVTVAIIAGSFAGARAEYPADEERPHLRDELARLSRLPHRLNEMRERMQLLADEADHELVVAGVDPVAREANVVRELLLAVGHAEGGVLAKDMAL